MRCLPSIVSVHLEELLFFSGQRLVISDVLLGHPLGREPLARRFQLICATMIAEALAGEEVVQLEYGTLLCLEPGVDQRRLAEAMGIDPSHASLMVDRLHS
ncbi:MAG: hypothetical protein ACJ8FK_07700, partial [Xanthobacteraceae bacterium]